MHSGNLVTSGENYGTLVRNGHGDKISFNFIHIIITLHLVLVAESLEHQFFFKKKMLRQGNYSPILNYKTFQES
jgi:hypothetical protein